MTRDNWTCAICFLPIARNAAPFDDWSGTLDHIKPVKEGGLDKIENLRAAHRWCNIAREGNPAWNDDAIISAAAAARYAQRAQSGAASEA